MMSAFTNVKKTVASTYCIDNPLLTLVEVEEGAMYYFLLNNRFLKRAMGKGPCHAVVV